MRRFDARRPLNTSELSQLEIRGQIPRGLHPIQATTQRRKRRGLAHRSNRINSEPHWLKKEENRFGCQIQTRYHLVPTVNLQRLTPRHREFLTAHDLLYTMIAYLGGGWTMRRVREIDGSSQATAGLHLRSGTTFTMDFLSGQNKTDSKSEPEMLPYCGIVK